QVFPSLTVYENVAAAVAVARTRTSLLKSALTPLASAPAAAEVEDLVAVFQLGAYRDARAATLPQGVRKLLDIAMALVGAPAVLLLDEPTSGISIEEKFAVMDIIMTALASRRTTVMFVEHDMEIVTRFAERVLAFHDGTVIADGPPAQALADPMVQTLICGTVPIGVAAGEVVHAQGLRS